jgi:hypothetical protein
MLSKDQILSRKYKTASVELEDGEAVLVRELSGTEGQELARLHQQGKQDGLLAWVACKAICDENGSRLFTDKELDAVAKLSVAFLKRVSDKVVELSGMKDNATEKKD